MIILIRTKHIATCYKQCFVMIKKTYSVCFNNTYLLTSKDQSLFLS